MKIVYLIEQLYKHGGAEKILSQKANFLAKNGYEVYIITTGQKNHKPVYDLDKKINLIDLNINYNTNKSYFYPVNFLKGINHFVKLKKILKKIRPDFIILLSDAYDYYFLTFITKAVTFKEFHSSRYFYLLAKNNAKSIKRFKYKLHDIINNRFNKLIVLNEDEKRMFEPANNVVIIPNGIEITGKNISKLNNKIAIAAGRIAPVKAFDKLITAWQQIAQVHPDWQLQIYGEGDEQLTKKLDSLIQKLKLTNRVCLCGSTNKLTKKMQNAGLYVMSSVTECFPMVLLEAQAVGLPIISFDCPFGPRNIIADNINGLLVENQNIDKLADAIIKVINNKEKQIEMGQNALINVQQYQFDKVMQQWIDLFNQCNSR